MQRLFLGSLLMAGMISPLPAQEIFSEEPADLPEMVVTATRSEIDKDQLATATTVYTRKDIERLQVNTVPDLLKGTVGIDLTQQGGDGKVTSVFMRGTDSSHILVMIDGIKVGSATLGTTAFELIPIDQIERVEIIRGPQSSLYGSEAIGGVIQIFTRKGGQSEKPGVTLEAGGGNYDTMRTSGTVSGKWRNSWYTVGASHFNTQGFDAREPVPGFFGVDQPDDDGYHNTGVNARIGHRFDGGSEIEASFMRAEGRTEYDGTFQNKTKFIQQVAALSGAMDLSDHWNSTLRLGQSLDYNDNFAPDGSFSTRFDTMRWNATWLNRIIMSDDHQLVFGSDYRLDEIDSSENFSKNSRYDVGIFGELHSRILDDHFINASLRWDENEAFGDYVTGNVGWRYHWKYGISPFASFGNAFKAPTFNDLYWPSDGFSAGNPNLEPEESTSFEVGLAGNHDWLQWEVRAYHTNIDNLINWALVDPVRFQYRPENVNKAQIDGIESEISTRILGWNSKLSMSLLSPRDRESNARLLRRYQKSLSFDLSRSFGAVDVGGDILAQGDRFDDPGNHIRVAGYAIVNIRAAYHFDKNWTINAKLNNLLDKQYQLVDTYNTADRNFFVSIHYNN
ncbi:MAG: TonB-dependent receptor domain-containing protein [Gammaproteobacteria bacterium]